MNVVPGQSGRLVIKANQSLSWQGNVGFILSILISSLAISLAFVAAGAWLLMPFILLEVAILSAIFYHVKNRLSVIEVISIDRDRVKVEKGRDQAEQCWEFNRKLARVLIERADEAFDAYTLTLSGEQGMLLLGTALTRADRDSLVNSLAQCGLRVYEPGNAAILLA